FRNSIKALNSFTVSSSICISQPEALAFMVLSYFYTLFYKEMAMNVLKPIVPFRFLKVCL
ncbi:Hypothetical predicted protein, partial [Pelobates cultripes]